MERVHQIINSSAVEAGDEPTSGACGANLPVNLIHASLFSD